MTIRLLTALLLLHLILGLCLQTGHANDAEPEPITLKLASSWPTELPILNEAMMEYAELVKSLSGGKIIVDVVTPEMHRSPLGVFDLVKSGEYDIAHTPSYYHVNQEPDALFLSSMPFGMTGQEYSAWFQHGGGYKLINEVYTRHGLEAVSGGNTGMQMGGWFNQKIESMRDLRGLRIRIPGAGGRVMEKLGARPVDLPISKLLEALQTGEIDALEWIGPAMDLEMGFQSAARYYYTGWQEPNTALFFLFNKERLASLPESARKILRAAAIVACARTTSRFQHENAINWASIKALHPNIQVMDFPADVISALQIAHGNVVLEEKRRSEYSERLLDALSSYVRKIRRWTEIGDWSYLANVAR